MQEKKTSGWRTAGMILCGLLLAVAGLCAVFHPERKLIRLYRRTEERLRVRPSRFETSF